MDNNINEKYLIVLKKNSQNLIFEDFEDIVNPLESEQRQFNTFFIKSDSTLNGLIEHIQQSKYLENLYFFHKYCVDLVGSFQQKNFSENEIIDKIKKQIDLFEFKSKTEDSFNEQDSIAWYLQEIRDEYNIRFKSYAINLAYKKCLEDNNIIVFSHRSAGWSNPVFNLNENFSIEVKTNFGFGKSSYFYTIIKYKSIEITPVSDWINYEHAKFSEIIRYTRSYSNYKKHPTYNSYKPYIENSFWQLAIDFARDACNLSTTNENEFIKKYVLEECEKMIIGLENIFFSENFTFTNRETKGHYEVNKKGHYLMEFRGEKISGSLEFVNKILEFKKITEVDEFITRLENCNLKIQPYLLIELDIISKEILILQEELSQVKPVYDELSKQNKDYTLKFAKIKSDLLKKCREEKLIYLDLFYLKKKKEMYPEYLEFEKNYLAVFESYKKLTQNISNLNIVFANIRDYEKNIVLYFNQAK